MITAVTISSNEFRALLKARGLTQKEFAERAGLARSTVSRWATGTWSPIPRWVGWLLTVLPEKQ
jgi:transcriptional regulator with XRE-family HTH domain